MEFTAQVIAGFLKGEIEGNPDIKVNTIAKIEEDTTNKDKIVFLILYSPIYITCDSYVSYYYFAYFCAFLSFLLDSYFYAYFSSLHLSFHSYSYD